MEPPRQLDARYPDVLATLREDFTWEYRGIKDDVYTAPVVSYDAHGVCQFRYLRPYVEAAHARTGQPLTREQVYAFDVLDALLQESTRQVRLTLQPGEVLIARDSTILHGRTAFVDHPDAVPVHEARPGDRIKRTMERYWVERVPPGAGASASAAATSATDLATDLAMDLADRYQRARLLLSEQMYGAGFQSSGAERLLELTSPHMALEPGERVLDLGCGTGGALRYLNRRYGAHGTGVDGSADCIAIARETTLAQGIRNLDFIHSDFRELELRTPHHALWTCQSLLYVSDKEACLRRVVPHLAPGRTSVLADYCRAEGPLSRAFVDYCADCGFELPTLRELSEAIERAGQSRAARRHRAPTGTLDPEDRLLSSWRPASGLHHREDTRRTSGSPALAPDPVGEPLGPARLPSSIFRVEPKKNRRGRDSGTRPAHRARNLHHGEPMTHATHHRPFGRLTSWMAVLALASASTACVVEDDESLDEGFDERLDPGAEADPQAMSPAGNPDLTASTPGGVATIMPGLEPGDFVRLRHTAHDAYLRDDGDNTVSADPVADDASSLWEVVGSQYGTQFRNLATGKYFKANTTSCITGNITGSGDAASWNEQPVVGGMTLRNYKQGECCRVGSPTDTTIVTNTCDHPNAHVEVEVVSGRYYLVDVDLGTDDAQAYCESLGSNLATITDAALNDVATDACAASTTDILCRIGINDEAVEGVNEWRDGTPVVYENWDTGGANGDNAGNGQDCAVIGGVQAGFINLGQWEYSNCNGIVRPFLCNGPERVREYVLVDQEMGATDAQAHCESLGEGYTLATITSEAENDIATALCQGATTDILCRIGINDEAVEGTTEWRDSAPVIYENWDTGGTNGDNAGNGQDCAVIGGAQAGFINLGQWEYSNCDGILRPFICSRAVL